MTEQGIFGYFLRPAQSGHTRLRRFGVPSHCPAIQIKGRVLRLLFEYGAVAGLNPQVPDSLKDHA